jgi:RNA polymerase sigma factor (sigma-70 family)
MGTVGTGPSEATLLAALADLAGGSERLVVGLVPAGHERMRRVSAPPRDTVLAQLDEIYRAERNTLVRLAATRLRTRDDAEDVVQTAYLKARCQAVNPDSPPIRIPRMFLFSTVSYECARANRAAPAHGDDDLLAGLPATEPVPTVLTDELLLEALARLSPGQRTCVILRHVDGFDTAETARLMGTSPRAVIATLHRAVHNLRRYLDDHRG